MVTCACSDRGLSTEIIAYSSSSTDVQADRWSRDTIYDMAATGTMLGMDQTKFAPTGTMTRAMAITVLYRMAGSPETAGTAKYTDTQATAYYADALV